MHILDVAGGTADVAMRIVDARRRQSTSAPAPPVTVLDINPDMLRVGEERARAANYAASDILFAQADAEDLPVASASVDAYVISFGMRNVPTPARALAEAVRVLRPGGRFMMLEFARVRNPVLRKAYDAYSFSVIPALGGVVAGDSESYKYLVESIRQFPAQEEFAAMMETAGLRCVEVKDYSGGIAAVYSGFKSVDADELVDAIDTPDEGGGETKGEQS